MSKRRSAGIPAAAHSRRSSWFQFRRMVSWIAKCCMVGAIAIVALLFYLRAQALPAASIGQSALILDIHGNIIDTFHSAENRHAVKLQQISPYLVQATLSIEDRRFYDHPGIDFRGLARAIVVDLKHMSKIQGASTVTQQLARNLYLTHERSWTRKAKEAMYTVQLEMNYTKDEILELYLNKIYYGHGAYGAEAAAQLYYHKSAKELTLAESSMLAGVPKGPKYYSPYLNMKKAKDRQKIVLKAMVDFEVITQQEADNAYNEIVQLQPLESRQQSFAPYFRDYIRYSAVDELGLDEHLLNENGIKIYTTLDPHAQRAAEEAIARHIPAESELQAALISIDPRNGHIKAMVGGTHYAENQFNRVFAKSRQPGSSFKPIVYLTALQQPGFTPATRFKSVPTSFPYDQGRQVYTPGNFGGKYANNYIDLRQAIAESDNIYAVSTIMQIGPEPVLETARRMGIDSELKPLPSLALGTFPVSPFEMASAYGVLSNLGVRTKPVSILKIVNARGVTLYEARPEHQQVVEPAYAYVLTNLMESVFEIGGTGSRVSKLIKRPVAGKSGTTNTDAWMVGYTPELSTAVWIGYDKGRAISTVESWAAAPIFAEYMETTLEAVPPKIFKIPPGVVSVYIDPETGKLAAADCPDSRLEAFVKGTEPTEYCSEHGGAQMSDEADEVKEKKRSWWEDLKRWWAD